MVVLHLIKPGEVRSIDVVISQETRIHLSRSYRWTSYLRVIENRTVEVRWK